MDSGHSAPLGPAERPLPPLPLDSDRQPYDDNLADTIDSQGASRSSTPEVHEGGSSRGSDTVRTAVQPDLLPRSRSQSSANSLHHEQISVPGLLLTPQAQYPPSNDDLYTSGDGRSSLLRTSSIHGNDSARSLTFDDTEDTIPIPTRSRSPSHTGTSTQALLPRGGPARTPPNASDLGMSVQDSPLLSHTTPTQIRRRHRREPSSASTSDFVVPQWQPDASVTMCPICRTQFSFFIRKHHCRKCGRVVCSSCSPHRITIPYQYIVQPPTDGVPSSNRPTLDRARVGSGTETGTLGGGERVRLCNPCVPDPNTAPPQSIQPSLQRRQYNHSRSASTASAYNSPGNYRTPEEVARLATAFPRRPREASFLGSRPSAPNTTGRGTSYNDQGSLRVDGPDSRSRSSTVGSSRNPETLGQFLSATSQLPSRYSPSTAQQSHRSLIPRMDDDRPLPSRPVNSHRPRIPEEDECWICHRELPSRNLEDYETLRAAHVEACISAAMGGTSPVPSLAPQGLMATELSHGGSSSNVSPSAGPSTIISTSIANTPEARSAARQEAHAAVVFGRSSPTSPRPFRSTGVFNYKATEKDCVDDAECTICLEEFEVGIDMGRLECFCRFHLRCIRQWFENHPGQCPVHQHGVGY